MTQSTTVSFQQEIPLILHLIYEFFCFGFALSYLQQYLGLLLRLDNTKLISSAK